MAGLAANFAKLPELKVCFYSGDVFGQTK